ncbi:MAG: VWA domain-containing protein [Muribaculaceae bacterium]|nr:VWA domain-containing protein [Muribaculaceae bacterium]
MSFAYPSLLYLLLLIPVIFGLWYWSRVARRIKLRRYGNPAHIEHLMPEASKYKPALKITLQLLALASLIIAVARPRAGEKVEMESTEGIEVMIAFDVSRSMLASSTDDTRGISRLDRAKYLLANLIDKLGNDKVGLIIFAGEAYTQLPITTDFVSAKMYLDEISTEMVSTQGTAIGTAINMAINSFSPAEDVNKAIIVITDGENHEGDAVEMAKYAKSLGIEVDVLGVGSIKGAPIPVNRNGEFLKDENGAPVTTFLNEKMAKEIASAGGGIYINGSSSKALGTLVDQLDQIKKSDLQHVTYKASAEQFPMFIWIAMILLVIDAVVLPSKIGWLKRYTFFSKKKIAAAGGESLKKDNQK